jgi:hypothetical protein
VYLKPTGGPSLSWPMPNVGEDVYLKPTGGPSPSSWPTPTVGVTVYLKPTVGGPSSSWPKPTAAKTMDNGVKAAYVGFGMAVSLKPTVSRGSFGNVYLKPTVGGP